MKEIIGWILAIILFIWVLICLNLASDERDRAYKPFKYFNLPEGASEIINKESTPDTLISWQHGDTLYFRFINKEKK